MVSAISNSQAWRTSQRHALSVFFAFEVFCLIFLQKFSINVDLESFGISLNGGTVELVAPLTYLGLTGLAVFASLKVDLGRLLLLTFTLLCATVSIAIQRDTYSPASVMMMILCYVPYIFVAEVTERQYREMLKIFINVMVFIGIIVVVQDLVQLKWSWRVWPNLNELIPEQFRFPNFNYNQPIINNSRLFKPQGVFFLEVSTLSQFTALAFALEIIYFRRTLRMVFFAVVLLICFAGTGIFLLLLSAPVLLTKLSRRTLVGAVVIFIACAILADRIHWYQQVHGRFGEFSAHGSSANARFVQPMLDLIDFSRQPNAIFTGLGPGNTAKTEGAVTWASTKVAIEYGFLTAIAFFAFFGYSLFARAPSQRMAFVLLVLFNFMGGGIIIPIYPNIVLLLGVLFRYPERPMNGRRRKKVRAAPASSRAVGRPVVVAGSSASRPG